MRKYAVIISLLLISLGSALTAPAAAPCPDEEPLPLRQMYLNSDVIVVGRIGLPGKWKLVPLEGETGYKMYQRVIPISAESTVKGAYEKLEVVETQYSYDDQQNAASFEPGLAADKGRRLFFLQNSDDEGDKRLTEIASRRELKLKDAEVNLYASRLQELAAIYAAPVLKKEALVEWLVRMAENPVTRFEGASEINNAIYENENQAAGTDDEKADVSNMVDTESGQMMEVGDGPVVVEQVAPETGEYAGGDYGNAEYAVEAEADPDFAALMTADQKERLIRAFLGTKFNYAKKTLSGSDYDYIELMTEGDIELMQAVSKFKDVRVAYSILNELPKAVQSGSWQVTTMLNAITVFYNDEAIKSVTRRYFAVAYGGIDEAIEDKASAYDLKLEGSEMDPESDLDAYKARTRNVSAELAKLPSKTYGERRVELMNELFSRCRALANQVAKK